MHLWHTSIFCYSHVFVAKIKLEFNYFKQAVIFQVCYKSHSNLAHKLRQTISVLRACLWQFRCHVRQCFIGVICILAFCRLGCRQQSPCENMLLNLRQNFDAGCFWTCFTVKSSDTRGVWIFKHSKISSNVYKKKETNKRRNKQTKNHKHPSGPLIWRYGTRTMFKGLFSTGSTLIQVWQNAFDKEKKYSSYSKYLCEATLLSARRPLFAHVALLTK